MKMHCFSNRVRVDIDSKVKVRKQKEKVWEKKTQDCKWQLQYNYTKYISSDFSLYHSAYYLSLSHAYYYPCRSKISISSLSILQHRDTKEAYYCYKYCAVCYNYIIFVYIFVYLVLLNFATLLIDNNQKIANELETALMLIITDKRAGSLYNYTIK